MENKSNFDDKSCLRLQRNYAIAILTIVALMGHFKPGGL
jgi:hypothetical protein